MKIGVILLTYLFYSFSAPITFAQEPNQGPNLEPTPIFSRKIIAQTDLEEPIANHTLTCKQIPKTPDDFDESETIFYEITTNEIGEATLEVKKNENLAFSCESKSSTTFDYCWYFPGSTVFFEISDDVNKNTPVYLVGQTSPETCDKEFSEAELKNGIQKYLPTGTPLPFQNKNLIPVQPTPWPTPSLESSDDGFVEVSFWQWIVMKIRSILIF